MSEIVQLDEARAKHDAGQECRVIVDAKGTRCGKKGVVFDDTPVGRAWFCEAHG